MAAAALIHLCLVAGFLINAGGPDWFLHLGAEFPPALDRARNELGRDVEVPHEVGHDGKSFWVLSQDPLLLDRETTANDLDRPAYRARRIAYPLLVAPWRMAGPWGIVWGLLITNVVIVILGTYLTLRLARAIGAPARAALAFALCPSTIVAVLFDLSDALALAMLIATLLAVTERRYGYMLLAGSICVLAREVMLLPLIAVALLEESIPRRSRLLLVAVPTSLLLAWALYARVRLGSSGRAVSELGWPFAGYWDVARAAVAEGAWVTLLSAAAVIAIAAITIARWRWSRSLVLSAALPSAVLMTVLTSPVLDVPLNSLRAAGPVIALLLIDYYSREPHLAAHVHTDALSSIRWGRTA